MASSFWLTSMDSARIAVWHGLAFERLCLQHLVEIRRAGVDGLARFCDNSVMKKSRSSLLCSALVLGAGLVAGVHGADTWTVYHEDHVPVKNGAAISGAGMMTPVQQLTNALACAAGDSTIVIKPGVYDLGTEVAAENQKDANGKSYLTIVNKTLFLQGEDTTHWSQKTEPQETVLKGGPDGRIIYGYAGSGRASVFKNLTFEGGTAESGKNGGAILFVGTEFIVPFKKGYATNCVFRGNSATHGGATSSINVYDSFFTNNLATTGGGGAAFGTTANGNYKNTNDFISCVFVGNVSQGTYSGGGALYLESAGRVEGCRFEGNQATGIQGGAVFIRKAGAASLISNSIFTGNSAKSDGGAVYGVVKIPSIFGCRFTENVGNTGGAVSSPVGVGVVASSTFTGNSARTGSGGAAYVKGTDVLTNCVFIGNSAKTSAGGWCASMSNIGLLSDCQFITNRATDSAGALWLGAAQDVVANCRFEGNEANQSAALHGESSVGTITNCMFIGNHAAGNAASMSVSSYSRVVDSKYLNNSADGFFSGVYARSATTATSGTVENCIFDNNTNKYANVGSQIHYAKNVIGCKFSGYGDMMAQNFDRCVFENCWFDYENYGGGMIVYDGITGSGSLRNCLFQNNTLHVGIKNATGGSIEIANCTFVSNTVVRAKLYGTGNEMDGYLLYAFRNNDLKNSEGKAYPSTNVVVNCLFANNTRHGVRNDVTFYVTSNGTISPACNILSNCLYETAWFVNNPAIQGANVVGAPNFLAGDAKYPDKPYYMPRRTSPARNKGQILSWMTVEAIDLAGGARVVDGAVDIGCYECDIPISGTMLIMR